MTLNINIDICEICYNDDFGYCGLRNSKEELSYKKDKKGNLRKCSGFSADKTFVNRYFKLIQSKGS